MTTAEKLVKVAENREKIYNAGYEKGKTEGGDTSAAYEQGVVDGKQAEHDAFWDKITNYGNKTNYAYGFAGWGGEYIRPTRKIIPVSEGSGNSTFNACRELKKIEAAYFDFSQKTRGSTHSAAYYFTFYNCSNLEEIEDIGMQADYSYYSTFANCSKLHTIAKIRCDENTTYVSNPFNKCTALENIRFEGFIGNSISFPHSPLSRESFLGDEITEEQYQSLSDSEKLNVFDFLGAKYYGGILGALSDTASSKTITLQAAAWNAAFTEEEQQVIVKSKPNWTFALN